MGFPTRLVERTWSRSTLAPGIRVGAHRPAPGAITTKVAAARWMTHPAAECRGALHRMTR